VTVGVLALAVLHILFGIANFQPGFPKLEGVAAIVAGVALLASLPLARRSMRWAFTVAFFGSLPLVAWFAYAVTIEKSSGPVFFWGSLVLPAVTGTAMIVLRHRAEA
jgi:hypothetical protein